MTDDSELDVHIVKVPGIGDFTFRKRNIRLEIAVSAERRRLDEGVEFDDFTRVFVEAVAALKVLLVDPPKGWGPEDIDNMDPYDDRTYGRILKVWSALRGKEETFRRNRAAGEAEGEGAGG